MTLLVKNKVDDFLKNNDISDLDNIDLLLEMSDLARQVIASKQYELIGKLIKKSLEYKNIEAFNWIMGILQEEYEKKDNKSGNISINLGKEIKNYDIFKEELAICERPEDNFIKKIPSKYGEIESFFNIMILNTKYDNVYIMSSENFDTKDNDFIEYSLVFSNNIEKYAKTIADNREIFQK